jgi:hypothetical protein
MPERSPESPESRASAPGSPPAPDGPEARREPEETLADTRMSLGEHLAELRVRLIKGAAAIVIAFVIAWIYRGINSHHLGVSEGEC